VISDPIFIQLKWASVCFIFQAIINSTITPNMTFTKTSQKFGQWADSRANTVYGLGFSSEHHLSKVSYFRKFS
jgi:hypothetical protein